MRACWCALPWCNCDSPTSRISNRAMHRPTSGTTCQQGVACSQRPPRGLSESHDQPLHLVRVLFKDDVGGCCDPRLAKLGRREVRGVLKHNKLKHRLLGGQAALLDKKGLGYP